MYLPGRSSYHFECKIQYLLIFSLFLRGFQTVFFINLYSKLISYSKNPVSDVDFSAQLVFCRKMNLFFAKPFGAMKMLS
jgi:hypothetical protein